MKKTAFTICAINYLSKAFALVESFSEHHPDLDFYIALVGKKTNLSLESKIKNNPNLKIIWIEDLGLEDLNHYAFKFDIIEFSTFIKPKVFQLLLEKYEKVIYLDPDIMVFSSLNSIYQDLDQAIGVLTPHTMTPIDDGCKPADLDFSRFGTYNLGFLALKKEIKTNDFLSWWRDRLSHYGYYEPQSGMAFDQKWLDLAVGYFPGFKISQDIGLNVAFWNLHERKISKIGNQWLVNKTQPLKFIHFSSFNEGNIKVIANKQNRFKSGDRPDFEEVSSAYLMLLNKNNTGLNNTKYCFDYFDTGERISNTLRRIYANLEKNLKDKSPFNEQSRVYRFAKKNHLLSKGNTTRANFKEIDSFKQIHHIFIFLLKLTLRLLGPDRYHSLMRYLAYVSSYQNQKDMFKENL